MICSNGTLDKKGATMHTKKITVDNHVKFYRKLNGLTQVELGALIGKTYNTISSLENYYDNPGFDLCIRLSRVFGLEVTELFFEKGKAPEKRLVFIGEKK